MESLRALNPQRSGDGFESETAAAQFGKQPWRQEPIGDRAVVAIANAAQIGAGPVEQIAFGEDDPRAVRVEAEMLFDGRRQFKRIGEVFRRAMCDGNDKDLRFVIVMARRENHRARPIWCLAALRVLYYLNPL